MASAAPADKQWLFLVGCTDVNLIKSFGQRKQSCSLPPHSRTPPTPPNPLRCPLILTFPVILHSRCPWCLPLHLLPPAFPSSYARLHLSLLVFFLPKPSTTLKILSLQLKLTVGHRLRFILGFKGKVIMHTSLHDVPGYAERHPGGGGIRGPRQSEHAAVCAREISYRRCARLRFSKRG